MRILGIDPGSAVTGYGIVDREAGALVHVAHGTVRPLAKTTLPVRLDHLYRTIGDIIAAHAPDCASIEDVFVAASARSALVLGQARGAILASVAAAGLPVSEYSPTRIKSGVAGSGRASKQQVKVMVKRLLALDRLPVADAADALAAAITHANSGRLEALGAGRSRSRGRGAASRAQFVARRPR